MVEKALNLMVEHNPNLQLHQIKILDPACGTGNFLIDCIDVLWELYGQIDKYKGTDMSGMILQQLHGCDIDRKALQICEENMIRKLRVLGGRDLNLNTPLQAPLLTQRDFLEQKDTERFHMIIGNPPYLENRKINKFYSKSELKKHYVSATGRFDLYSLFIENGINSIDQDQLLSYIIPGTLLYNNNFEVIRRLILKECKIIEIIHLGEGIFEDVGAEMVMLLLQKFRNWSPSHEVNVLSLEGQGDKPVALRTQKASKVKQSYYNDILKNIFDISSCEATFKLRDRVMDKSQPIKEHCEVIAGVATGNSRGKILLNKAIDDRCFKVLEGKNIERYKITWGSKWIHYDKSIILKDQGEYATFMKEDFIHQPKILIRQTAYEIIATYDEEGYYLLNTLYSLLVRSTSVSIKYVLAVLNSKLLSFLYQSMIREKGKSFPQVKIFHIQNAPLVIPSKSVQEEIEGLVTRAIKLNQMADGLSILKYKETVEEINKRIYHIYGLTTEERALVESRMQ